MSTEYDFIQNVNPPQLLDEINTANLPDPDYMNTDGNNVQIFYTLALTTPQVATLNTVVTNHVANANYVTIALQTQINTLLGYLNNANMTIANTARAIIVQNIAPNLPLSTMTTINIQIKNIVGS